MAITSGELPLRDFSGGWNIRDAPTEIADNESPDLLNMTLDERGGVSKRLGQQKLNSSPFGGGAVKNIFSWDSKGFQITQAGTKLYRDTDGIVRHTFTTSDRVGFTEFNGSLYVIHPVDGLFASTDGLSYSLVSGGPHGNALLSSKNRLIALGDGTTILYASAIGDAADWTTGTGHGWTNEIREVSDAPLIAAAAIGGEDVLGRPGFMLFKNGSFYRVYDSDTGAYTTMDATVGAASPLAAVGVSGRVVFLSTQGIFWTDGVTQAARAASERLQPLFQNSQIAFDQASLFCGGVKGDRVKFSLARAGSTVNDLSLEYHPLQGWIVPGTDAAACYTTNRRQTERLYAGSPSVSGQVYEQGVGGSDDGADITCRYQTKWFSPLKGIETQFRRVRVFGRGLFDLYSKLDFDTGDGEHIGSPASLPGGALVWGSGDWGEDLWAPANYEDYADFWSLGNGTSISFLLEETSSISSTAPKILNSGTGPDIGAFALYGLVLQYIPIGR